ncbi:hypothetical protein KC717_06695, partial [Candidatus Dojkabacteria bacterium]|nr:hypothetical protein [Candidatus Dojkabacteria bacterium]
IVNFEQMILPFLPPGNRFQDRYKFFPRVNDQQTQGRTIWIAQHHFIHIDHNFKQDITITPSTRDNTANVSIHIIHGQNDLGTTRGFFESSDLIPSGFFPPTLLPSDEWYFIQSFVDNPLPQAQVA